MSEKRMLAILGSPIKGGTIARMLECTADAARNSGWKVDQVNLYEKHFSYCTGCRSCIRTGKCYIEDDIRQITALIKECDVVVLAAPVYWANVPAVVKNLFDRLLGVAMEETATFPKPRLSGKKYILLTACNTPAPFSWIFGQSRGAIRCMDEFFRTAGMECVGKAVATNTSKNRELSKALIRKLTGFHLGVSG